MSSKQRNQAGSDSDGKKPADKNKANANVVLKYSGMAFQMAIILAIGLFIGQKLDEYFKLEDPYLTLLCILLFGFLAFYIPLKDLLKRP